jgi:hypothetical protein
VVADLANMSLANNYALLNQNLSGGGFLFLLGGIQVEVSKMSG